MTDCKVYKGLEQHCRIKGLLSKYFYICFMAGMFIIISFIMSVAALLKGGSFLSFLLQTVLMLGGFAVLYAYLLRKSNVKKIKQKPGVRFLTNKNLYVKLYKKLYKHE